MGHKSPGSRPSCAEAGVVGALTGIIGSPSNSPPPNHLKMRDHLYLDHGIRQEQA